ncbi:MAG: phenylalanine--tRNA ligase subunit beta, partial [Gammaproteobacteria bacterium]|nr:phenylalanine--tRNA ligase subunit beta [Gammaproteobacteria bacterium]
MQFNVEWLKQWVAIELDADALAERLTASGLEVDEVRPAAGEFSGVVVAEIEDCGPHPNADKLSLCTVNDGGDERLQIVCGAPNARPGIRVPLARVGGRIGPDFKIKRAKLRGIESHGMLCSARELGLSDDHSGLMELPTDAPVGTDLHDYLGLDDAVIEVDLTPNRADCLSVRGIARDVSASCDAEFTGQAMDPVPPENDSRFPIRLEAPEDCPRYAGRIVRGIDPTAKTPLWMAEKLRRCGLRSISPTVDVTNYVLLELGQPMHAFDLDKLNDEIVVRRGRAGEKLVLLDESEVDLDEDVLAICDSRGPVAIAGIMGGLDSGVTENTRDILFESAYFKPATIMGKARAYGMHTDASHRFERGVDPSGQEAAVERATQLLIEIAGGEPGPVLLAEEPASVPRNRAVTLRPERLELVLGCPVSNTAVEGILGRLGMAVDWTGEHWSVTAPPARFDIEIEEDLVEEVARIHGYDRIPEAPVSGELAPGSSGGHRVSLERVRESLCAAGYQEAINYSFVDRKLLAAVHHDQRVLPLANPLSSDMDVMRTTLLPGLLTALSGNLRRQQSRVRLFETGAAFLQEDSLAEPQRLAGVAAGEALPEQWGEASRPLDFFDIKGDIERLLAMRGDDQEAVFEPAELPWMHPGASARITVGGKDVGWCGAVHPSVQKSFDIKKAVFAFELELDLLLERDIPFAKEISRFPSVRRDLALLLPNDVSYDRVRDCVADLAGPLLEKVTVFDVYQGGNLKEGYKSLAIGLIFNNVSSTLKDEDVDPQIETIVSGLGQ